MWMEEGFAACICFLSGCLWAQELKYKRCKMLLLCWFHGRVACISCSGGSTSSVAKFLVSPVGGATSNLATDEVASCSMLALHNCKRNWKEHV